MKTCIINHYSDRNGKGDLRLGFPIDVNSAGQEFVRIGQYIGDPPVLIKVAGGQWPAGQRASLGGEILECDLDTGNVDDLLIQPQTAQDTAVLVIWRVYRKSGHVAFEVTGPAEILRETGAWEDGWGDYSSASGQAALLLMRPGSTATAFLEDRTMFRGRTTARFRHSILKLNEDGVLVHAKCI
jgi:hypothetical protein